MKDLKIKIKRQTEILGLVISNPCKYSIADFEVMFNVNEPTINRDLNKLRSLGIDIHSKKIGGSKSSGITINQEIPPQLIKSILPEYIGITINQNSYDQSTNLLIRKLKQYSISIITLLNICIDNSTMAKIRYYNVDKKKSDDRIIEPYLIFQSDKQWRLLAKHEKSIKQFMLSKIESVEPTQKKYKPITQKQIDDIFATSFKSWLGEERYKVRLKFNSIWAKTIKHIQLMEFEKKEVLEDGSVIYETVVNSLSEITSWILSRGEGVVVLEPESLRKSVIESATNVLKNYQ